MNAQKPVVLVHASAQDVKTRVKQDLHVQETVIRQKVALSGVVQVACYFACFVIQSILDLAAIHCS